MDEHHEVMPKFDEHDERSGILGVPYFRETKIVGPCWTILEHQLSHNSWNKTEKMAKRQGETEEFFWQLRWASVYHLYFISSISVGNL